MPFSPADEHFMAEALASEQIQSQRITGNYTTNHDTLVIHDITEEPSHLCGDGDTGIYTFQRVKDTMYFKVIKDLCERRKLTFEIGLYRER